MKWTLALCSVFFFLAPAFAKDIKATKAAKPVISKKLPAKKAAKAETKAEAKAEEKVPVPLDLNTATLEQLTEIKGIGEKKAKAILDFRANTPIKSVDDLKEIKGIGDKLVEKIRPHVTVEQQKAAEKPAKKAAPTKKAAPAKKSAIKKKIAPPKAAPAKKGLIAPAPKK